MLIFFFFFDNKLTTALFPIIQRIYKYRTCSKENENVMRFVWAIKQKKKKKYRVQENLFFDINAIKLNKFVWKGKS